MWISSDLGLASGGGTQGSGLKIPGLNLVFVVSMIMKLPFIVIVLNLCMFDSIFFSHIHFIAVPALKFRSLFLVKCFHMSFQSCS